jgi:hypothetical protein
MRVHLLCTHWQGFQTRVIACELSLQCAQWKAVHLGNALAALSQGSASAGAAANGQQQKAHEAAEPPLLAVDPRKLRGEEEMRRIFGARILREEERDNAGGDIYLWSFHWINW